MRRARIKEAADEREAVYHLISRTVNGEWVIDSTGKEVLRRQIWQVAEFAGLQVITYAILSNHFHILVRVPRKAPIRDEELLRRYHVFYPRPTRYQVARLEVIRAQLATDGPDAVAWRKRQLSLMNDVSQYMKLVKERFSIWHNKTHHRFGPVWSDRFKSVHVERKGRVLEALAAYIDLNCVRAGIVDDPKDYRFCGYAEAVAGSHSCQTGLSSVIGAASWSDAHDAYRRLLFVNGSAPRQGRARIPNDAVEQVLAEGGRLTLPQVLRCRIRYLSDGAVLGSRMFVEAQLAAYRRKNHCGERMAPRALPHVAVWGETTGLRRLPRELFG